MHEITIPVANLIDAIAIIVGFQIGLTILTIIVIITCCYVSFQKLYQRIKTECADVEFAFKAAHNRMGVAIEAINQRLTVLHFQFKNRFQQGRKDFTNGKNKPRKEKNYDNYERQIIPK